MNKICPILLSLLSLVCGCTQAPLAEPNPMLCTVPSDAVAVVAYDRLEGILDTYVDSTDVLNRINYGRLLRGRAALAFCYTSSLTPVLTVEVSPKVEEDLIDRVIGTASSLKLSSRYIGAGTDGRDSGVLALSPSETLVASVERHLKEDVSIMDAQYFPKSPAGPANLDNAIYLKNSAALRWLEKNAMSGVFTNRETADFLRNFSEWMILVPGTDGSMDFYPEAGDSPALYWNVLSSIVKKNDVRILDIAPSDADFVLSESTGNGALRPSYESFLDAMARLDKYQRNLADFRKGSGRDALDIEKELGVREVALVRWEGRKISLLRCERESKDTLVQENPFRGVVPALYGKAFLTDDGWMCLKGNWRAFGNKEDMEAFAGVRTEDVEEKNYSFYLRKEETCISRDNKGIRIWNLKSSL